MKFAIVGFGHIGKIHANTIIGTEGAHLVSVIDVDEAKLIEAGREYNFPKNYASLEDFLRADDNFTDVISICVPNGLHASLAIKALKNGYHVIVEKPMALSRKECEAIIQTASKNGKQVFVAKQNRFSPPVQWLKSLIEKKQLGEIYIVQIACYWNRDERYYGSSKWRGTLELDGGTLFTQFSHFIDVMYWIFGDIKNIQARFYNFNHNELTEFEDSGIVQFEFVKGGGGSLGFSTSCWDKNMESSIIVVGSKGTVKIGGQYMNEVEYCHIEGYEMPELEKTLPPNDYGTFKGSAANHYLFFQNVMNTLLGKSEITTNANEGLMVIDIIERIYLQRQIKV